MSEQRPQPEGTHSMRGPVRSEESLLRGGLQGIVLVTLATAVLAGAGALVALIVSLLY